MKRYAYLILCEGYLIDLKAHEEHATKEESEWVEPYAGGPQSPNKFLNL